MPDKLTNYIRQNTPTLDFQSLEPKTGMDLKSARVFCKKPKNLGQHRKLFKMIGF